MAILKGINGGSFSGSVGKVTFRKGVKGKIIASQKAESVSNPRTRAQQEQRMFMKTAVTAYSAMKEICNHSFEGVSFGQKSMAKFIELNVEQIRNYSTLQISGFTAKKNGSVAPQPYIVSKGSLNGIELSGVGTIAFSVKGNPVKITNSTWGEFSNLFGLNTGDQIEVVALYSNNESIDMWNEEFQENLNFSYARYVISKNVKDTDKILADDMSNFNENLFSEIKIGKIYLSADGRGDGTIKLVENNCYIWCAAVIVSRKQGNKWLRSTSKMLINGRSAPSAYRYENVLKSYDATSAKYLNNATD